MKILFSIIRQTRSNFTRLVDGLTVEQLNVIPEGFNNNIAWHFGHIMVSQQVLCYVRGNCTPRISEAFIAKYRKGTKPESFIGSEEIQEIKRLAVSLIDDLEMDLGTDLFKGFLPVQTEFGVELSSVNDAVPYFATHDNLHFGYAQAMRRLLLFGQRLANG